MEDKVALKELAQSIASSHRELALGLARLDPEEYETHRTHYVALSKMLLILENEYFRLTKRQIKCTSIETLTQK